MVAVGQVPFHEPGLEQALGETLNSGHFIVTGDTAAAVACTDITMIAVGTPVVHRRMNLEAVVRCSEQIGAALKGSLAYHVVVVRSTVVPGTTMGVVRDTVCRASERNDETIGWCSNPEFLREGTALADFRAPDRVVIGASSAESAGMLYQLYGDSNCPFVYTSPSSAEMAKCVSNYLLATLVSLGNEVANVCESIDGVATDDILSAVFLDRRLTLPTEQGQVTAGIVDYLHPGIGFGGSCLPKDVESLAGFAADASVPTPLLDAVTRVNRDRPERLIKLIRLRLGDLRQRHVAVLGLAFKPGTDDLRDSPPLRLIAALLEEGACVRAFDPKVSPTKAQETLPDTVEVSMSVDQAIAGADAVIIATAWPEFGELVHKPLSDLGVRVVLDGRNMVDVPPSLDGVCWLRVGAKGTDPPDA